MVKRSFGDPLDLGTYPVKHPVGTWLLSIFGAGGTQTACWPAVDHVSLYNFGIYLTYISLSAPIYVIYSLKIFLFFTFTFIQTYSS